jgi:hypothetical protein
MTDTVSPEYALAMRALAAEEMRGAAGPVTAGDRALARLREQLLLWFGPDGVHALFARAINRAAVVHPLLADVRPIPEEGRHLDRLASPVPAAEREEYVREALVMLLATLFALLGRLVGHDLVVLVTSQIWPTDGGRDDRHTEPRSRIRE